MNKRAPKSSSPGIHFGVVETCDCLRCGAAIPPQNIDREIVTHDRRSIEPTQQILTAVCDACGTVYKACRELRGNGWELTDGVAVVTDDKERHLIARMLAEKHGTVRRAS